MYNFFIRSGVVIAVVFGAIALFSWFDLSAVLTARAAAGEAIEGGESGMFQTGHITITTADGYSHDFQVELAVTPPQQRRGLMFRKTLGARHGMLFDYHPPRRIAMWMKNTFISLDMVFFDVKGRIAHMATHTEPLSQDLIATPMAIRYVLEVPAGTVERLRLGLGDRLQVR